MISKLLEVTRVGLTNVGILDIPKNYWPEPGQYLPCQNLAQDSPHLSTPLFKVFGPDDVLRLGPLPARWEPGDSMAFLPPQGNGFKLPPSAQRVGLLTFTISPIYLLSLTTAALNQGAAVSLFCKSLPTLDILNRVPPRVEIGQIPSLINNLDWPDFLGVDIEHHELKTLSTLFDQSEFPFLGQVLVRTPMPCRGLGDCGVCSVKTRSGWRLACVDGPVFSLAEVLHVD